MKSIIMSFLDNLTVIIVFMYIALKVKERLVQRFGSIVRFAPLISVFISLLSIIVMYEPLMIGSVRLDLRGVPIFYISYLLGWKYGILTTILPIIFRIYLGGSHVILGIKLIITPFIIGSLFYDKKEYNPPYTIINYRHMFRGFMCYQLIRALLILYLSEVTFLTIAWLFLFEAVAIMCIFFMWNEVSRNLLLRKNLEYTSTHDSMTNLYNIRYFRSSVEGLRKNNIPFVIAMMDVDDFKNYNDTHGHPAGDEVLRTIGELLKDNMRKEDIVARYGGEEFIICFTYIRDIQTAITVAERFRKKVEDYSFPGEETQPNQSLTISIGLSSLSSGKTLDQLIKEADQMLYRGKHSGRNNTMWGDRPAPL